MGQIFSQNNCETPERSRECQIYGNNEQAKNLFLKFLKYANIPQTSSWTVDEIIVALILSHFEQEINCALENNPVLLSTLEYSTGNDNKKATNISECSGNANTPKDTIQNHQEIGTNTNNKNESTYNAYEQNQVLGDNSFDSTHSCVQEGISESQEKMTTTENSEYPVKSVKSPSNGEDVKDENRLIIVIRGKNSKACPINLKSKYNAKEVIEILYESEDFYKDLEENDTAKMKLKEYVDPDKISKSGVREKVQSHKHMNSSDDSAGNCSRSPQKDTSKRKSKSCFDGNICGKIHKIILADNTYSDKKEVNVIFDEPFCKTAFSTFLEYYLHGLNAKWTTDIEKEKNVNREPALLLCFNFSRLDDDVSAAVVKCSNLDAPVMLVIIQPCEYEQEMRNLSTTTPGKPIVALTNILYSNASSQCFECDFNKKAEKDILTFLSGYKK
ncbi:uncharacterized protein LOC134234956 [Saccostrea cucullata]|uniref:uncharacterized protein LOC134234956 n=1 Tax=Saccostrea cuccullata TaxID=36930 RepID=UPI002ED68E70